MAKIVLVSIASLAVGAIVLALYIYGQRKKRYQDRLDEAFERARMVQRSGSGVQGKPYSLYGASSWSVGKQER